MSPDERVVFNQIESSGTTGIWTKTMKARTNLHQTVITKCLKNLESKRLVKPVVSVRFPKRKIYMLHHLSPSEDVIGGLWFSDGELDVDLVETLAQVICRFVEKGSWKEVPFYRQELGLGQGISSVDNPKKTDGQREQTRKRNREAEAEPQPQTKKRRQEDARHHVTYDDNNDSNNNNRESLERDSENDLFMTDVSQPDHKNKYTKTSTKFPKSIPYLYQNLEPHTRFRPKLFPSSSLSSNSTSNPKSRKSRLVPLPSTSPSFPTASSILHFLQQTQISQVELTPSDLRTLLDMLVYDGRLERIGGPAGGSAGTVAGKGEEVLAELESEGVSGTGAGVYKYRTVRALERDGETAIASTTIGSSGGDGSRTNGGGGGGGSGAYGAIEDGFTSGTGVGVGIGAGIGSGPGNGLSEVPCGRCPVFNLCEVGGPVNAEECVYLDEWLKVREREWGGDKERDKEKGN